MSKTQITDILSLIQQIRDYEPNIVEIIFDYVFVPCNEVKEGKHKYIRAMPSPGTNTILEAFYGNKTLEMIIIDDSVKTIGAYAFYECSNLTQAIIGESVEIIGDMLSMGGKN